MTEQFTNGDNLSVFIAEELLVDSSIRKEKEKKNI